MTGFKLLLAVALIALLTACQTGTGGFGGRKCVEEGHAQGTPAWQACVDRIYAREKVYDMRGAIGP
jgi:hypothetical protein